MGKCEIAVMETLKKLNILCNQCILRNPEQQTFKAAVKIFKTHVLRISEFFVFKDYFPVQNNAPKNAL